MNSPEPLISLRDITKTYGNGEASFQALAGVDLTINRGEFVAIMGPSGSGKSTLLNLLGCLDQPTSGTYQYENIHVESLSADQRSLLRRHAFGFIFQGFNLLARTSAIDNVAMPLIYRGSPMRERRQLATAALEAVGLADKTRNIPSELSGGQQQRVAIARAIATSPVTLFADEPTGNLDSHNTVEIMQLLTRLNQENGITILLVTHEDEVASYASRVVVVRDGLIESDTRNPEPLPATP